MPDFIRAIAAKETVIPTKARDLFVICQGPDAAARPEVPRPTVPSKGGNYAR